MQHHNVSWVMYVCVHVHVRSLVCAHTYNMCMAQWSEHQRLKLEVLGSIPGGHPVLFSFSIITSLCLHNWMMSMSALVQLSLIHI